MIFEVYFELLERSLEGPWKVPFSEPEFKKELCTRVREIRVSRLGLWFRRGSSNGVLGMVKNDVENEVQNGSQNEGVWDSLGGRLLKKGIQIGGLFERGSWRGPGEVCDSIWFDSWSASGAPLLARRHSFLARWGGFGVDFEIHLSRNLVDLNVFGLFLLLWPYIVFLCCLGGVFLWILFWIIP